MSSDRARIASATIAAALVLLMGISGMASAMVEGITGFAGTGAPSSGQPRVGITEILPTDCPTEEILDCATDILPTLTPLPSVSLSLTPLPSVSLTPLPSVSLTPLPSVSLTPLPSLSLTPLPSVSSSLTPLPSISLTPLPSVSVSPLPTVTPTDIPPVELPDVTEEKALEISGGVGPPAGDPDTGLLVTAHYKKGKGILLEGTKFVALTLDLLPTGGVVTRGAVTAEGGVITQNAVAGSSATGANADGECGDATFSPLNVSWKAGSMPIGWRIDKRSIPAKLSKRKTKRQVKKGLVSWSAPRTRCSNVPNVGFAFAFDGLSAKNPKRDGVSVIDWGPLSSAAVALTYTWYVENEIVEFDMRLNSSDYKWTVSPTNRRKFQVRNTVAHEAGHALGLGDLSDPHGKLTMFGVIYPGELKKTTLGRGDLDGAQAKSP